MTGGSCAVAVDSAPAIVVGPGCTRRDLPGNPGVRIWVVDIAPGAEWPHLDRHDAFGEEVFVVSGELIEGERRYGPGLLAQAPALRANGSPGPACGCSSTVVRCSSIR